MQSMDSQQKCDAGPLLLQDSMVTWFPLSFLSVMDSDPLETLKGSKKNTNKTKKNLTFQILNGAEIETIIMLGHWYSSRMKAHNKPDARLIENIKSIKRSDWNLWWSYNFRLKHQNDSNIQRNKSGKYLVILLLKIVLSEQEVVLKNKLTYMLWFLKLNSRWKLLWNNPFS